MCRVDSGGVWCVQADGMFDAAEFAHLIYTQRMRTAQDRAFVKSTFERVRC